MSKTVKKKMSQGLRIGLWTALITGILAVIGTIAAQMISTAILHQYSLHETRTAVSHITETAGHMTPTFTPSLTPTATASLTLTPTLQVNILKIIELSWKTEPEYIVIQNFGPLAQDLSGWTLSSREGEQHYHFPDRYILNAGATVRVESFTGAKDDPPAVLLWWHAAVWSNNGDTAELRNADNELISSKCYGDRC